MMQQTRNSKSEIRRHRAARSLSDFGFVLLATAVLTLASFTAPAAFVYETPSEFFTSADFNGDGVADVLVLDKLTGNARVGYADGLGHLTWSAPLVTGVQTVSGCAAGHFKLTTRDVLVVTATNLNRVQLYDLSNSNSSVSLGSSTQSGLGPHSLAALSSPFGSPPPPFGTLLIASSLNDAPAERLDIVTNFPIGFASSSGQFPETGSFERANDLPPNVNGPSFAAGLVRGTNDTLHLWQFTNTPSVILALSNLPPGSDYVFGNFNGEALPRFIFYQPGGTNLTIYPLIQTNTGLIFGAATVTTASEPVQQVFYLPFPFGSAILRFSDGVQAMTLSGGVPAFSAKYNSGSGAAGNVFTGIAPVANGQFALFDAPSGSGSSVHDQVVFFNGMVFTQVSATNLPTLSSKTTRANAWLFQLEPFVNRDAGFIASVNASDWSDSISGLPGALNVVRESDAGTNSGLGSASTSNLGTPPTGATNGLPNQYNPAISVFTYSAPRAAEPVSILISPPPGAYAGPITISLSWPGTGRQAYYRVTPAGAWQPYSAPFLLTNDATVQYYGAPLLSAGRSQIQFASYTVGNKNVTPPSPVNPNPGNTNPPPVLSTNAIVLSGDGTVFYGRRGPNNFGTIWAINLDGSGDTYITTGVRPRVSRDGRWLAFLRENNPFGSAGNIWKRDLLTGVETRLFSNPDFVICYDWEPNAAALLTDYQCGIWDLNTIGSGGLSAVIASDCGDDAPVRNPVDGRIAFHNINPNGGVAGLYLSAANGGGRQRILSSVGGATWPAWSPDGANLAFSDGNSASSLDTGTNLWVVRPDGTGLSQITGFSDGINRFPHGALWSPDGSALVGAATIFGTNGLWIIPLDATRDDCNGAPIRLPTTPGDAIDFAGSVVVAPSTSSLVYTQAPGLFIRQTPDAVVVYWNTNFVGYTLESESNLLARAWISVAGPYYQDGGYFEYWETRGALSPTKFFRLHLTGAVVLSQPPALAIQVQTNTVVLSWPANFAGFTLQTKTDLSLATVWNDLPEPYPVNGDSFQYHEPVTLTQKFYRLRGP